MRQLPVFLVLLGLVAFYVVFEFGPRGEKYGKLKTFDRTSFYSPKSVPAKLKELAPFRDVYLDQERTPDLIFPLLYSAMFAVAIQALLGPGRERWWWLVFVPIGAAVADYAENLSVMALLRGNQEQPGGVAVVASTASALKGSLLLLSFGLVALLLLCATYARFRPAR